MTSFQLVAWQFLRHGEVIFEAADYGVASSSESAVQAEEMQTPVLCNRQFNAKSQEEHLIYGGESNLLCCRHIIISVRQPPPHTHTHMPKKKKQAVKLASNSADSFLCLCDFDTLT